MALSDARQCTAKAKSTGERCNNPAVTGRNVCRLHGGKTPQGIAHPNYVDGRRSKYNKTDIVPNVVKHIEDRELLKGFDELRLLSGLINEQLERLDTLDSLEVHQQVVDLVAQARRAYKGENFGLLEDALDKLKDIADNRIAHFKAVDALLKSIESMRRLQDSQHKILQADENPTSEEVYATYQFLIQAVVNNVSDTNILQAIREDFARSLATIGFEPPRRIAHETA